MRSIDPWRYAIFSGYEPKLLDNFVYSGTSAMIFQDESGDIDTRLSEKCYLHYCSFRSEKNQRTWDELITLMKKVCCQLSPLSHTQVRWDPYTNIVRAKNKNQVATWRAKELGISLKDKKSKFSLKSELRSTSTKFKPILIEEVSRNWMELLCLSEGKLIILLQVMSNADEINYFFKNNYQNKNRDLREVRIKSLHEKDELKRVEELRIDESSRRRLIENQDTVHELTARIQELQNEVNCMNDSRDF